MLEALLEAGANPVEPMLTYDRPPPHLAGQFEKQEALCLAFVKKRDAALHQRLVNASFIASLVSYWRHVTYKPGSKAARGAVARCEASVREACTWGCVREA